MPNLYHVNLHGKIAGYDCLNTALKLAGDMGVNPLPSRNGCDIHSGVLSWNSSGDSTRLTRIAYRIITHLSKTSPLATIDFLYK